MVSVSLTASLTTLPSKASQVEGTEAAFQPLAGGAER